MKSIAILGTIILCSSPFAAVSSWAQVEPCSFFERNTDPGYDHLDFLFSVSQWQQSGSLPQVPDWDGNGIVNVLDLVREASCLQALNHGLVGSYYGYNDTYLTEDISFPDFNNLDRQPVVIRPVERLEEVTGWQDFMDSEMRHQFGAVYEGYLFVPESATYNLHIFGTEGMRLYLDGNQILSFDGNPREDDVDIALSYGLHPLRIEFYTDFSQPRILFDWSSNGSIIGNTQVPVDVAYLYHSPADIPENTQTELELHFTPESGSRVTNRNFEYDVYALGAGENVRLFLDDEEVNTSEGHYRHTVSLNRYLNTFTWRAVDGDGREVERKFHVFWDAGQFTTPGAWATVYSTEWYESPLIDLLAKDLQPIYVGPTDNVHLEHFNTDGRNTTQINLRTFSGGTLVKMKTGLRIRTAGTHEFRITGNSGMWINGEFVAGVNVFSHTHWQPRGQLEMVPGFYDLEVVTASNYSGPEVSVYITTPGAPERLIDDLDQSYGSNITVFEPPTPDPVPANGRFHENLMGEWLFNGNDIFEDSSGWHHDLTPDERLDAHAGGGASMYNGAAMKNSPAGHLTILDFWERSRLSLEADIYVHEQITDWRTRPLISITDNRWNTFFQIATNNDRIRVQAFTHNGLQASTQTWDLEDYVQAGQRLHIVATIRNDRIIVYVNGQVALSEAFSPNARYWPGNTSVNVGMPFNRDRGVWVDEDHHPISLMGAAVYSRDLSQAQVQQNRQANININPNPAGLPTPTTEVFPPPGTSAADLEAAHHYLNRLTFGPTIPDLKDILANGLNDWLNRQLDPDNIDDSACERALNSEFFIPTVRDADLKAYALFRMTRSKKQLLEVMTQFWENHFNTQLNKTDRSDRELEENLRFRHDAFGNFADLLLDSAMGYTMTVYLDNDSNRVGAPNENYARELMELFAMGVNNGYTQDDIIEGARCFTGWTVRNGDFFFDPGEHDYGEKNLLGITIPAGGGIEDAVMLINHIVGLPETADFITWKLCQVLIADDPPADVWSAASTTFQNTNGDMEEVIRTITSHPRFLTDTAYRANKTKTPLEFLASTMRLTDTFPISQPLVSPLSDMAMDLFNYADPTGFAEEGVAWLDTNSMLRRWNFVNMATSNRGNGMTPSMNIRNFILSRNITTYDEVLDFMESITTHGRQPAGVRPLAENWLTGGDPGSFTLDDETINGPVRQVLSFYLRLAEMNRQ